MRTTRLLALLFLSSLALPAAAAAAPLTGAQLWLQDCWLGSCGTYQATFTVVDDPPGPGAYEVTYWPGGYDHLWIDIDDTGPSTAVVRIYSHYDGLIGYPYWSADCAGAGCGFVNSMYFTILGPGVPAVTGVSLSSLTSVNNPWNFALTSSYFDPGRLGFTGTTFWYDLAGLGTQDGDYYQLDLQFEPVPEPASMVLLGLGLAVLATRRHGHPAAGDRR